MAWLPTNGLIRNFTVVVANIADGATPARHLRVLRPSSAFRIVQSGAGVSVDPRGYDRYAVIADAIASVDPVRTAKLYATLKPRIEEAHRELGSPDPFDRTLERAIVALLNTPAVDAPARPSTRESATRVDERLESLTARKNSYCDGSTQRWHHQGEASRRRPGTRYSEHATAGALSKPRRFSGGDHRCAVAAPRIVGRLRIIITRSSFGIVSESRSTASASRFPSGCRSNRRPSTPRNA
jgi:hypothetical protein